jgi:hypothetical protein
LILVSTFAFKCNLYRYSVVFEWSLPARVEHVLPLLVTAGTVSAVGSGATVGLYTLHSVYP